jgi:hypothetical protein
MRCRRGPCGPTPTAAARLTRSLAAAAGAFAIAGVAAAVAAQQVRDNALVAAGTASVSGTVFIAGDAKQPARRARVTLTDFTHASPGRTTTTDDRGAFAFHNLPAGRFELRGFKAGYLMGSYGASRPNRAGTPIVVTDGQRIADRSFTIARGGVITGIVRDARGRPVAGLNVRVLKLGYHAVTGEAALGPASAASLLVTDDRGEYRAFGLPPGGYLVLVDPRPPPPPGGEQEIRQFSREEVRQAMQAVRPGAAAPLPSSRSAASVRVDYAPVFHPGTTDIGAAATVALDASEERRDVDVTIQLVPTATISGTITSPSGALPPSLMIRLPPAGTHVGMLAGAGLRTPSVQPRADGTYAIAGVAPGSYTVQARVGARGGRGGTAVENAPTMWAAADVTVSGQDLDVPLTLQNGVAVSGRVVFAGTPPTAEALQTLSFRLIPLGAGGTALYTGGGRVDAEGRFTFAGVIPDTYQFTATWTNPAAGNTWTIASSVADGRDAFEAPLRVEPGAPVEWTVTFTDRPATLAGGLQDAGGRPATDYYILLFSADRAHWTPGSRRVRMTRPATDGAFSVRGMPPGEYLVVALTDLESGEWNDPALLAQLVPSAVKVTLRKAETTRRDFRIGGL